MGLGKSGQPRDVKTIRYLLTAQIDLISRNISRLTNIRESVITKIVINEGKIPEGDRHGKLGSSARAIQNKSYEDKMNTDVGSKLDYLLLMYGGPIKNSDEDSLLKNIKWRDIDLKDITKAESEANVVVIGTIDPPLNKHEMEVLALDPKFATEDKVGWEAMSIALEEGKIKMQFGDINNHHKGDNEDQAPTDEEIE